MDADAEAAAAGFSEACEDAVCDATGGRPREALRVEGDEGACRVAALVVRRVMLVDASAAAEEAQVLWRRTARGRRRVVGRRGRGRAAWLRLPRY